MLEVEGKFSAGRGEPAVRWSRTSGSGREENHFEKPVFVQEQQEDGSNRI